MPNKKGMGLLLVFADVPADKETDFNKWYNEEHLPELTAIPGVLNAARYEAVKSGPKHLAVYELETPDVVRSDAWLKRRQNESDWSKRCSPRYIATTLINNVYQMIHPTQVTAQIAQSDMAPVLQIGRMNVSPLNEQEWNNWYSTVYVPNYEKVPGCIRGRRWKAVSGWPTYAVMYELENEKVSESAEWQRQRDIDPSTARVRPMMIHAVGSPGVWKKTFQVS